MCVKLLPRDLNPDSYPAHPTNTYTYEVITTPKVHGGSHIFIFMYNMHIDI